MRDRMPKLVWVGAAVLLLSGCGIFKGKINRENIEPPTELADFAPGADVDEIWTASVGDGEGKLGLRQPVAVDGGVLYAADLDGNVRAIEAATGRERWRVEFEGVRWSGGPGVGEGTLVIGSLDGTVVALNPDNGAERWRKSVSSEVISSPAVARGLAVVRSNDGRVFGFSIVDGERKWIYDRGLPSLTLRGNARPVIAGDTVYLGYDTGDLVALRVTDGSQVWEQTIAEGEGRSELDRMVDVDGEIVVQDADVFVASFNGQVMALDAASGRPLWNREMSSFAGVSLAGEKLLVTDKAGTVWALDRRSGASLWRQDGLAHRWLTTPVADGELVAVGDLEGYVHWLKLSDGTMAARDRVGGDPIRATPQVADGVLYVQTIDGDLSAYRARAR
ncbi:MAG: outer membrane protein assembly factor BamB [Xanthomonadales bacterium]|nr:outer membrane protein assembly factor BamB [Xanthomonadales bacterium]